ncbi:endonuclease/exonuclease/phosphatase family protein [Lewinella sp. LCG006]|uniref:endonuclease/exonuclease/phosphatase family protein n=1 Tax=Lewinella sp. LCG006 TaxID=3231911 RepID=UPI00345F2753
MVWITVLLVAFCLIAMIFPLLPSNSWLFNIFTYPRIQIICIQMVTVVIVFATYGAEKWTIIFAVLMLTNVLLIFRIIKPYTRLGKKELLDLDDTVETKTTLSLLIWNVYQFNQQYQPFIQLVKEKNPDLLLLCETNEWWTNQLQEIRDRYPYHQEVPLENTYGMCLYSRHPCNDVQVKSLVGEDVPSIRATITLEGQHQIAVFGIHPIPPYPAYSTSKAPKDAELLLIAQEVSAAKHPCIVFGDMNDVAWSNLTTAFQKISRLLDPRRGRGIMPTFHAKIPLMRIPIDQIFCSSDFRLIDIKRMPAMGSDHFPIFVTLALTTKASITQTLDMSHPNQQDQQLAEERIAEGLALA